MRYLPWRFGTLGSVGGRGWSPRSCPALWFTLTECLLGRGMPWETEGSLHMEGRRLVQDELCGCYVGLSPGRSDSRAHSLIHLLLLPKPWGVACRSHQERGRSDWITCLVVSHKILCELLHSSQPHLGRGGPFLRTSVYLDGCLDSQCP